MVSDVFRILRVLLLPLDPVQISTGSSRPQPSGP